MGWLRASPGELQNVAGIERRIYRHVHAGDRGLWRGAVLRAERRIDCRGLCRRPVGAGDGLCSGADLGRPFQSGGNCGLVAAGRFDSGKAIPYIVAQVLGGVAAAAVFYLILQGAPAAGKWNTFLAASNTYGGSGVFTVERGLDRNRDHRVVCAGDRQRDIAARAGRLRADSDRAGAGAVSPGRDSGLQCLAQPGAFDRDRVVRRHGGVGIAVAVSGSRRSSAA